MNIQTTSVRSMLSLTRNNLKQIGPFVWQIDNVSKYIKTKGLSFYRCHGNKSNFLYMNILTKYIL